MKEKNGSTQIRNKSFNYLLPLCGSSYGDFKFCKGIFIDSTMKPEYKKKLHLLYNVHYSLFEYQYEWFLEHNLYIDSYHVDEDHIMIVFDLPKNYEHIYDLFLAGKYFEMDDEYKQHILKFFNVNFDTKDLRNVLYKSEVLFKHWEEKLGVEIPRSQNIASIPNIEDETFNLKMISKKNNEWI